MKLKSIPNVTKFIDKGYKWKPMYGYPQNKVYTNANTKLYEVFDVVPKYIKKYADKHFKIYSMSMIKQPPGQIIPEHNDTYYKFKKKHNIDKNVVRFCIFLEDWKPGHCFEINNKSIAHWKAGNYLVLKHKHRGANIGNKFKYTAQITGVLQ